MHPAIEIIGILLGPGGAAFVAVKSALNGVRAKVDSIDRRTDRIEQSLDAHIKDANEKVEEFNDLRITVAKLEERTRRVG